MELFRWIWFLLKGGVTLRTKINTSFFSKFLIWVSNKFNSKKNYYCNGHYYPGSTACSFKVIFLTDEQMSNDTTQDHSCHIASKLIKSSFNQFSTVLGASDVIFFNKRFDLIMWLIDKFSSFNFELQSVGDFISDLIFILFLNKISEFQRIELQIIFPTLISFLLVLTKLRACTYIAFVK